MIHELLETEINDVRGEDEVRRVTQKFGLSEFKSLIDFHTWNDFSKHIITRNILSIIISDYKQGFSHMSPMITELRTRLTIENVPDLMFISFNGFPVENFNLQPYVKI